MISVFKKIIVQCVIVGLGMSVAGCQAARTTQAGAVGVDRNQFFVVSSQEIESSSAKAYRQVLAEEQKKGTLNRDPEQVRRIRAIASRLIPVTGAFRDDAPGWKWEVNVITSKQLNAWCMAGGKIAFYTGLIDTLKLTDDEIAAVMGHEIAHALREHSREQASEQMITGLGLSIGGALLGLGKGSMDLANMAKDVLITLPHSRSHETEADRIGVELAARAGYNPEAAITLWQKMGSAGGSAPPQFLSTHPAPENRMADLKDYSQRVEPLYEAARRR